ncbi:hypothetical protein BGZ63DRAFT_476006 [Mariannaea sp. PMI_226]|nr:hypothetical protein BGZ63DRAFT_476006 [Mariannaea sp. PMI_226]
MTDPVGAEIVVEQDTPFLTPKRSSREVRPMSKVRDTARQLEDTAKEARRSTGQTTHTAPSEEHIDRPIEVRKSSSRNSSRSSDRKAMLQEALDLLGESRRETKRLELKEVVARQEETVQEMSRQMVEIEKQMTVELQQVRKQLQPIATSALDGPQRSYANSRTSIPTAPPTPIDALYCTIILKSRRR